MDWNKQDLEIAGSLRRLLKNRFLLRSRNEKWFQTIIDHRLEIQKSLSPMGALLEINEPLGVAYIQSAQAEMEEALDYQLGRKKQLSALASLLLFHLRNLRLMFYTNPGKDDFPVVSTVEIREFLQNFNSSKIDSQFEKTLHRAIKELTDLQVLLETKEDSDVFEISSLCDLLLPADQIREFGERARRYFGPQEQGAFDA
jgi:hypothetical protein